MPCHALGNPSGQGLTGNGVSGNPCAVLHQGIDPTGFALGRVQSGQDHQTDDGIVGELFSPILQSLAAVFARLARWNAQLQYLSLGKQTHRTTRSQHFAPIEIVARSHDDLSLGHTLRTRSLANRVLGFHGLQGLVAANHIELTQALVEVLGEAGERDFHARVAMTSAQRSLMLAKRRRIC